MQETRYQVVEDLQGGEFGMYRKYTIDQWRKQALEWCWADDNEGLAETIMELQDGEVIQFIEGMWSLEMEEVSQGCELTESDLTNYEDETVEEFYKARFE